MTPLCLSTDTETGLLLNNPKQVGEISPSNKKKTTALTKTVNILEQYLWRAIAQAHTAVLEIIHTFFTRLSEAHYYVAVLYCLEMTQCHCYKWLMRIQLLWLSGFVCVTWFVKPQPGKPCLHLFHVLQALWKHGHETKQRHHIQSRQRTLLHPAHYLINYHLAGLWSPGQKCGSIQLHSPRMYIAHTWKICTVEGAVFVGYSMKDQAEEIPLLGKHRHESNNLYMIPLLDQFQ